MVEASNSKDAYDETPLAELDQDSQIIWGADGERANFTQLVLDFIEANFFNQAVVKKRSGRDLYKRYRLRRAAFLITFFY